MSTRAIEAGCADSTSERLANALFSHSQPSLSRLRISQNRTIAAAKRGLRFFRIEAYEAPACGTSTSLVPEWEALDLPQPKRNRIFIKSLYAGDKRNRVQTPRLVALGA
jgi:hypothetical protein